LEKQNIFRILIVYKDMNIMKKLHPLFKIIEIPIYLLIIGILTLKTNIFLAILLMVISIFRLYINLLDQ
jgi:hypothetical protein